MTKKINCGLIVLMLCFLKCTTLPKSVPTTSPTNFIIEEPELFTNCYLRYQQTGAPTTKISVVIYLKTSFYDGTRKVPIDEKTLTVNPNTTPFPVTIAANMPNDGSTPGEVEVTIHGVECSECAAGHGSSMEPTQACQIALVPNTSPQQYRAARPQWSGTLYVTSYSATRNLGHIPRMPNVSNSCGCTVQ